MSRTGVANPPTHTDPDPRFPFPHSPTPTRCQTEPGTFDFANGDSSGESRAAREKRLARARRACSGCPIVTDCLKWALVNQPLTKVGIFASTTPKQRTALRKRIVDRLGPDWIDVLADQDQAHRERAAAARHTPLTVNQARIIRLDRDINGPMRKPLTPAQQQRNMARLMAGLKAA
ncbi:WhiB family transcriptional regulator [Streptomyces tricolor]|uniref:WhiB family transcriptional regulator n=1 Tax=Streptomyces tricolor TaxID=68277 RepID=UPI003D753EE5